MVGFALMKLRHLLWGYKFVTCHLILSTIIQHEYVFKSTIYENFIDCSKTNLKLVTDMMECWS